MGFFRSSESRTKHKSRFSFRRHSDDDAELKAPAAPPVRKPSASSSTTRPPAHPQATSSSSSSSTPNLRATVVSSASTSSASSSISSPTALRRAADNDSELKRASDSRVSTDTEDSGVGTPSDESAALATPRESLDTAPMSSERIPRHSLVGYSKLQCSMSYKNRMAQGSGADDPLSSSASSASSLRASFNTSGRRSESGRSSSARMSRGSTHHRESSGSHHARENSALTHIDELAPSAPSSSSSSSTSPAEPASVEENDDESLLLGGRVSELRRNEASVAALQTRRAFQQMVLAMEDDGDSSDYDSEDDFVGSSLAHYPASGGVVQLGADDYRKFQFRLRQLEELTAEQAQRQAHMEESIEREVAARTKKVVDAMEKKIAMYKQAKDLEVEREIQRRVSENSAGRMTSSFGRESSFYGGQMLPLGTPPTMNGPLGSSTDLKGKPLDKIFHPRRTRRRMELLREREEQQKREMEQFREFIRSTEMHSARATGTGFHSDLARGGSEVVHSESARASIKALRDPHITEDLLGATQNELIEMICVLRKHVSVQETQLDEAKRLISAAIEAREDAEETAREAVELTMELDSRLERASQEIVVIKDELRRSSDFSMRSSYLLSSIGPADRNSSHVPASFASNPHANIPRTASYPNFPLAN